jgi:hypothetical protein
MKKFKYFSLIDLKKEAIGIVKADNIIEAYHLSSLMKKLSLKDFKSLFKVEQL